MQNIRSICSERNNDNSENKPVKDVFKVLGEAMHESSKAKAFFL